MSATKVDAIVRVVGVYRSPSTVVSAFKGLLLMSNCGDTIAKPLLAAVFPSDAPIICAIRKPACISLWTIAVIPECGN